MKTCIKCKADKAADRFSRRKKSKDGRYNTCRDCRNKQSKKYVYTAEQKQRRRELARRNIDRLNARANLRYRVKSGRLIRPTKCDKCGVETKTEAHHYDYSEPFKVAWLCRRCHVAVHTARGDYKKRMPKGGELTSKTNSTRANAQEVE